MAENPLYKSYAIASAADIWQQLSDYAKKRIHFVFSELLPEDLHWYENLDKKNDSFYTEYQCSVNNNVWLDCIKNEKEFYIEYNESHGVVFYENCHYVKGSYCAHANSPSIKVDCDKGRVVIEIDRVIRSAYSKEELIAN